VTIDIGRWGRIGVISLLAAACSAESDTSATRAAQVAPGEAHAQTASAVVDTMVVYKTPTCGCCNDWVDHAEENGFVVITHDLDNLEATKRALGVPAGRVSCHTATVQGYTIEGHVPADLIRRLIAEKPRGVKGLAVPGMPMGSPGMEGLIKQNYDVLSFDEQGNVEVYARR
jgi:hypothetical protein